MKNENRTNGYKEFNLISLKIQMRKSNFCESYFDISKYAQKEKVLVGRNMLTYDHMDECGIGTDSTVMHETNQLDSYCGHQQDQQKQKKVDLRLESP